MGQIEVLSDFSERVHYPLPDHRLLAFHSKLSSYRNLAAACHWHDDFELMVLTSGHMQYAINCETITLQEGQGILINGRQLHSNFSGDGTDCRYACVVLHPSLLYASPQLEERVIRPIQKNASFVYQVLTPAIPWQQEILKDILAIVDVCNGFQSPNLLLAQSYAYHVFATLLPHLPARSRAVGPVDRRLSSLRDMVGFVQGHYPDRVELDDIAAAGNVSKSSCHDIFKKHLDQSPIEYLTRYRLDKGMELLHQPGLSVLDIALATGFSGPSYFTESFRKCFGVTPSAYRKQDRA